MVSKMTPLLATLREQKEMKMKGGIYHKTQIDLTYKPDPLHLRDEYHWRDCRRDAERE